MIVSQDWDPCPLHFCSQSSQMLSHRIVFLLRSSSWSLGRHHKHLCRNLCNCTCRRGLLLTDPLPDKTLFSQAGFEDCVCLKIASGRYTHIFCYKLYNVYCVQNINSSICDIVRLPHWHRYCYTWSCFVCKYDSRSEVLAWHNHKTIQISTCCCVTTAVFKINL